MARKKKHPEHVNHERWLVSYADFITLLFAFFVVMFAVSQVDTNKVGRFTESVRAVTMWSGPQLTSPSDSKRAEAAPSSAVIATNINVTSKAGGVDLRMMRDVLRRRLRSAIVNSRISIELENGDLVVRLQDCGMFEPGSDQLLARSVEDIRLLGEVFHQLPYPVRIEGHTDSVAIRSARFRNNWELSAARAVAVLECLTDKGGMPESRMMIAGFADTKPVADNSTEEGRKRNRRVDIVLTELAPSTELESLQPANAPSEDAAPAPPGRGAPASGIAGPELPGAGILRSESEPEATSALPASPTDAWVLPPATSSTPPGPQHGPVQETL